MLNGKRILGLIPARGGSCGILRKNLLKVGDESLLERTIRIAQLSQLIDTLVISSEDDEIIALAKQKGVVAPFIRPAELANDTTPSSAVILHALSKITGYDYLILLQVTSPMRRCIDIDNSLRFCLQQEAPACVSVSVVSHSPHWLFMLGENNALYPVLASESVPARRQDSAMVYTLNGAIYIADIVWFMQTQSFVAARTVAYVMPPEYGLDIDTMDDVKIFSAYLTADLAS